MIGLRIAHILAGVIWVGGGLLVFVVLLPRIAEFGPAARGDILRIVVPFERWLAPASVLTVASGITIALRLKRGVLDTWLVSGWGYAILVAFAATLAYMVIGLRQTQPHIDRLKEIASSIKERELTPDDSWEVRGLF